QHHAAEFDARVAQSVVFHIPEYIEIDENRQLAVAWRTASHDREMLVPIGAQPNLRLGLFEFAKLHIHGRESALARSVAGEQQHSLTTGITDSHDVIGWNAQRGEHFSGERL